MLGFVYQGPSKFFIPPSFHAINIPKYSLRMTICLFMCLEFCSRWGIADG